MAYIKQISIKDASHITNAISYVTREGKAYSIDGDELRKATFINCTQNNIVKDFENVRIAWNQNRGVIAHHYVQSFQKDDDITHEKAHEIGIQLAQKMFPNYQAAIATHIDKEHVHNHIIVNSCNMITGQKWYSNKKTLDDIQKESDKLCLQNSLGVIQKNNKYKGLDQTTYQLAMKKKSWKVELVNDLNSAVKICRSKKEFIDYMNNKDYSVRYKDVHITITKIGEKKGIRVDTLAKQFGEKYTKDNLEKLMGYYVPVKAEPIIQKKNENKKKIQKSNWEHFELNLFKRKNYFSSEKGNVYRDATTDYYIRSAERSLLYSRNAIQLIIRLFILLSARRRRRILKYSKKKKYSIKSKSTNYQKNRFNTFGNITYKELRDSAGETFTIKVLPVNLLKLVSQPILYSAVMYNDSVSITVKAKDKDFLLELLDMSKSKKEFEDQSEQIANKNIYTEIKKTAEENNQKLQYLMIDASQLQLLKNNYISFAYFQKGDKYNIAFLPDKLKVIQKILYEKREDSIKENIRNKQKVEEVMKKYQNEKNKPMRR